MRNRPGLIAMVVIILVSNAVALIGVGGARSGGPIQTIELTERELSLQSLGQDNSGITLRFNWANRLFNMGKIQRSSEGFFDQAKLEDLGFRLVQPPAGAKAQHTPLPRTVFVAFEYEGDSWQRWLKKREADLEKQASPFQFDAEPRPGTQSSDPERRRRMTSHLFLVDAGRSYEQLRQRYPDQQKHLIVKGVVRATLSASRGEDSDKTAAPKWRGHVTEILPMEIFVPAPYAKTLSGLASQTAESPRYSVTLHYGRTFEPWIANLRLISGTGDITLK